MTEVELRELRVIFPGIPAEAIRRAMEITGSANAASDWLLEHDWRELMASQHLGELDGDEDEEEEDSESDSEAAPLTLGEPAHKRARKLVTQESGSPPVEGADSFWCAFDSTTVHKGHLQLLNLRPRTLGHSRIALSTRNASSESRADAERALADVWTHCLAPEPGYWLVPVALGDLDDVWWKLLEPLLLRRALGSVVVIETLPNNRDSRVANNTQTNCSHGEDFSPTRPRFDELEHRATSQRQRDRVAALAHRMPPSTRDADHAVAAVVLLASGEHQELHRVGTYLAALFPNKTPLYFRRLRSTADAPVNASSNKSKAAAAFAHDPRADPGYLHPDWHQKHADVRVSMRVEAKPSEDSKISFVPTRQPTFLVEQKACDRPSGWCPIPRATVT